MAAIPAVVKSTSDGSHWPDHEREVQRVAVVACDNSCEILCCKAG